MNSNTWNIDASHSSVTFSVRHMVFAKVRGRFGKLEGTLNVPDDEPARAEVEVAIDAASIDTGVADRDHHLRSADFLDVATFPKLVFKSQRVEPVSGNRYRLVGELTLRDVTREVVLDVEYNGRAKDPWGNDRAALSASTSIERSDFGLRWNQLLESGGVLVGERIDIELEVQAVKASAAQAA
jgi:polyisoprenoid-binding protein YceI